MKSVSDKHCIDNQNTNFGFNIFSQNLPVYEVIWKNMVEMNRPQMIIAYRQCALHTG